MAEEEEEVMAEAEAVCTAAAAVRAAELAVAAAPSAATYVMATDVAAVPAADARDDVARVRAVSPSHCASGPPSSSSRSPMVFTPARDHSSIQQDRTPRPTWTPDWASERCTNLDCTSGPWNLFNRRHHCRLCGGLFCDACSNSRASLAHLGYTEPQRVCEACCVSHHERECGDSTRGSFSRQG